MDPIICPYEDCDGLLEQRTVFKTDAFYLPLDTNAVSEVYKCDTCGREVKRSWKWSAVEKN